MQKLNLSQDNIKKAEQEAALCQDLIQNPANKGQPNIKAAD